MWWTDKPWQRSGKEQANMKYKLIAAAVTAAILAPYAARAEEWIELSSWSYNEVSGFVADGLMPEMLEGKGDYRQPITRGEFAEIIYSVLDKTGMLSRSVNLAPFTDCDGYTGAQILGSIGVAEGVSDINSGEKPEYEPENNITREDAAVLLSRAVKLSFNTGSLYSDYDFTKIQESYDDISELSDYAINPIRYMFQYNIMSGDDQNRLLNPKGLLSVEEAVLMAYRYYKALPRVVEADNEHAENNSLVQSYECGLNEIYRDGVYYIEENDGTQLMSFESDVYSSLLCCEYGGERLCFAVNFNDQTDVYNLDTKALKYTVSDIVYEIDANKGYAYTYSGRFMPVYSGMWSMKGYLNIPSCYSRSEVDELIAAAEERGVEWYPEPTEDANTAEVDGILYYSDTDNGGWLCSVDSNGNNRKVLVKDDCRKLLYCDGVIYYVSHGGEIPKYYCVSASGGEPQYICDVTEATFYFPRMVAFDEVCDGESLEYYKDLNRCGDAYPYLWGNTDHRVLKNGMLLQYEGSRGGPYEVNLTQNGVEKKPLSDFPVWFNQITATYDGSGRVFFANSDAMNKEGMSPLYMYDGTETKKISGDYNVISYGFKRDRDGNVETDKIYFTAEELGAGKCAYVDLETGEIHTYNPAETRPDDGRPYNPVDYNIAYDRGGLKVGINDMGICVTYEGKTNEIPMSKFKKVIGDYVYYINAQSRSVVWDRVYYSDVVRQIGKAYLYAYNYKTGETVQIADDYYSDSAGFPESGIDSLRLYDTDETYNDIFIYNSTLGECKQVKGTTVSTIFPNKGIHRCGKLYAVGEIIRSTWTYGFLYKVDEEGHLSELTDRRSEYWMYVPNGEDEPNFAYRDYYYSWWV